MPAARRCASASTSITSPRSATRAAATIPIRCARRRSSRGVGGDGITAHLREDRRHIRDERLAPHPGGDRPAAQPRDGGDRRDARDRAAPQPARRLHRARKARGAHHRGRARRRRPAQPACADRQPPARRRHPRQPVHRPRRAPDRSRDAAGRAGGRVPHRRICACRGRAGARSNCAASPTWPRSPPRTASSRTPATG